MSAVKVVVGRQPIFDRALSVMGYELLFRTLGARAELGDACNAAGAPGDLLTAEVLFSSVSIGVDRLVGDKRLFCNASRGVLTGTVPIVLPPERTVVEVLETVVLDDEVLAGCRRLRDEGFVLALDDFSWVAGAETLLELASIVKIDIQATRAADRRTLVERCRRFDVELVAEKVETTDELRRCEDLGFDYFQGYLLARPRSVPGRALDPGRVSQMRMSARLLDTECPVAEIEEIVRTDPAMVHQLLKLAGVGAAAGMQRKIRTVREALVLLGWRRLQSWLALLLVTDKSPTWAEEITVALTRARMCELAAHSLDRTLADSAFVAGMLSSLGVLLGVPLGTALEALPLHPDLRSALLTRSGPIGWLVADVSDYLLGRPQDATRSGLDDAVLSVAALSALTWAVEATSAMERD